jgi:hypothetical protein
LGRYARPVAVQVLPDIERDIAEVLMKIDDISPADG